MIDVIVVGAGPAGSIAALLLARAGARVWLLEREALPRPKLCGDTLNPGAVASLAELGLTGGVLSTALPIEGMLVTSLFARVRGRYPDGHRGLAIARGPLDHWLAQMAAEAGARLECRTRVRGALWNSSEAAGTAVAGVSMTGRDGRVIRVPARITIAADGRRSVLAREAGLTTHPKAPRRWAFGMYVSGVRDLSAMGEMHIRQGHYIGVSPAGGGLANVCAVTGARPQGRTPREVIERLVRRDRELRARTAGWDIVGQPQVLGPLAVDGVKAGMPGLLLAGDAAGFIDPMTGDGVHLAIRGGMLAASVALEALESGRVDEVGAVLTARRRAELGSKLRFNRWMRALSGSAVATGAAGLGARVLPGVLRHLVSVAGDVRKGAQAG